MDLAALRSSLESLVPFFLLYLAAIGVEWCVLAVTRRGGSGYDWRESATNVTSWVTAMVAWFPLNVATFIVTWALWPYRLFDLGTGVGAWIVAALAWDFSFYWQHRAEHAIRVLWAGHVTHHSAERFNYSTALRQSWTPWTGPLFYPWWALLGVHPVLLFVAGGWNLLYQFFLHTELVGTLPQWIEGWLNAPSHHRVHHASNTAYRDRNFGGALIVWDRLFGTFAPESERPVYGIVEPVRSVNPLWIQAHEYVGIARDLVRAKSWRDRLGYLFRGPGWSPDPSR